MVTAHGRWRDTVGGVVLPILFCLLYAFTAQRGVSWGDSGLFQYRLLTGDLVGEGGLACAHPLYILTGTFLLKFVPRALDFWFMNALSGFWMSCALALLYRGARLFGATATGASLAVLTLGLSHAAWSMSTLAEVYTLSLFALSLEVYFGLRFLKRGRARDFVLMAFANGLHFGVHNFALLNLPVHAVLAGRLMRERRAGALVLASVVWLIGALPILLLGVEDYRGGGELLASVKNVLVGNASIVGGVGGIFAKTILLNFMLTGLTLALPLFLVGARFYWTSFGKVRTRPEFRFVAALFAVQFVFWIRYFVPDQWTFALPTLFLAVLLFSAAAREIGRPRLFACLTVLLGVLAPLALNAATSFLPSALRQVRFHVARDNMRYFVVPWKQNERSAEDFAVSVGKTVGKDALVYADFTNVTPLACRRHATGRASSGFQLASEYFNGGRIKGTPARVYEVYPFGVYKTSPGTYRPDEKVGLIYSLKPRAASDLSP